MKQFVFIFDFDCPNAFTGLYWICRAHYAYVDILQRKYKWEVNSRIVDMQQYFQNVTLFTLPRCKKVKKKKKRGKKAKFLNNALQKNCYYHKFCIHCWDMRDWMRPWIWQKVPRLPTKPVAFLTHHLNDLYILQYSQWSGI